MSEPSSYRQIVLGSASPARGGLLRSAGIAPVVRVSGVDEPSLVAALMADAAGDGVLNPSALALRLAIAKARDVAANLTGHSELNEAIVIGCDSILEWQGQAFGKPETAVEATERWRAMRATMALLHTGHCVIDLATRAEVSEVVTTVVWFADLTDAEVDAYVAATEPLAVAGAFTLDGLGSAFVDRIDGDPSNVVGLSIPWLRRTLTTFGIDWPDLWMKKRPQ